MRLYKILFLLLITFSSCQKSGQSYVRGHFYIRGTNTTVNDGVIWLRQNYHGGNSLIIDSTHTDANGYYKLNFKKLYGDNYFITAFSRSLGGGGDFDLPRKKTVLDIDVGP